MKHARHHHGRSDPSNTFEAVRLTPEGARRAFPLVRMLSPHTSLREWLAFARRLTRRSVDRSGIIALTDRRQCIHAIYVYRLDRNLSLGRFLRISDVMIGELAGARTGDVTLNSMRSLAAGLGCPSVVIESLATDETEIAAKDAAAAFGFLHRPPPLAANRH